jgi:ankyrin repeat protein
MSTGLPPKEENDSSTLQPSLTDVYGNAVLSEKDEDQNRGNQTETSSDEIFIVEEHSDEELYDDSGDDDTSKNLSTPKDILDAHEKLYAALFEWNDADAVAELLKKGTSIDAVDSAGRTVLHRIVGESENEDLVESLLLNGADRWKSDNFGSTPLMEAVRYSGTADVIQMLVRGIRDKDSNTTEEHRLAVFQEDKNRVNSADTEGRTALHWAAGKAEAESIRRLLLSLGADKSKKDKLGRNPLVHAIQSGATEQTVRLLASGIDLESRDTEENTALHHAVKERNFSAVDVLLDLGADIHSANLYGRTALHEAVKISHDGTLKLLLQHKAKPNRKDYKGATALMLAAEREKPSLIQTLLNNGAKVEATDNRGKTAVHYAIQGNQLKSLEILLENDAEVRQYTQDGDTALHIATYEGNTTLIWPLLDHGAELEAIDASGRTPLLEAILKGRLEIMKILLAAGADRNFRFKPSSGKTALEIVREDLKKARELAAKDTRRKQRGLMKLKKLVHESSRQIPVLESMEEVLTQLQGVSSNIDIQKQLKVQSIPVSNYALDACKGFQGVVVDFLAGRLKKNLHGHASVYELLYGGGPEAVIQSLRLYGMNQNRKFRWHHLPANNVSLMLF